MQILNFSGTAASEINKRNAHDICEVSERAEKHPHQRGRRILEKVVLGGSDGIIESLAATSALNGVQTIGYSTIVLAGFAFAVAGSVAMFFSSYLSRRSELDSLRIDIERERYEIETEPEEEKRELTELLKKEGYTDKEVSVIMNRLEKNKEMWLRAQLRHELHLHVEELENDPLLKAAPAGIAFFLFALIPIFPYIFGFDRVFSFIESVLISALSLFVLGSTKLLSLSNFNAKRGLESSFLGTLAALIMYLVGRVISPI
jgi:VIT1/CCC1 family predicted Fe2+/Mn2+ transporter